MAMEEICFPNNLRKIRTDAGIKMTKVAEDMGLSLSAMSKFEKGYRRMNQKQLVKICKILNCKLEDIFIKENQRELVDEWQVEMSKRVSQNTNSGLKIFGAGLRYLRKQNGKIISEIAKEANLTLSVYHRIEVGSRDLYEDELQKISRVMNRSSEDLMRDIYKLYEDGKLNNLLHNETKTLQPVLVPGSPMNSVDVAGSLYGSRIYELTKKKLAPIYGVPNGDVLSFNKSSEKLAVVPNFLENKDGIYVVLPVSKRLMNILPSRSYFYVNPIATVQDGDLAVVFGEDYSKIPEGKVVDVKIVSVKLDGKGNAFGYMYNPDEKIKLDLTKTDRIHKVVLVAVD